MRIVWLLILALLASTLPLSAVEWTLLKHDGREYISFENMAQFYGLGTAQRAGNRGVMTLGNRCLRGEEGSPDFFINNLKFILSYPVAEIDGKLCVSRMDLVKIIEPVLRPSRITGAQPIDTIILDPGHGGHDSGAGGGISREKDFTLDTAQRARLRLMQAGFKVYLTRTTDVFVGLEERVAFANKFPNALFVSVHFNYSGAGTGIETYTLAPRGVPSMMADGPRVSDNQACPGNCRDTENIALATATHASLIVRSHMFDRGIKRARFVVIRDIQIPGVLIEGGFLSNGYDARLIAQPAYRENLAAAIVEAALNYRTAVSAPGTPPLARNPEIVLPALTAPDAQTAVLPAAREKATAPVAKSRPARSPRRPRSPPPRPASRSRPIDRVSALSAARPPASAHAKKPIRPIGVFDSGVGGLTVAAALRDLLPSENIFYIGDTARVPYGGKSQSTIERYSVEISGLLLAEDAKVIVVACNTASALAVPHLQELFKVPIIGVIAPGAKAAVAATRTGRIGVMGTRATVYSKAYERAIHALDGDLSVLATACPLLVPLIEEGWLDDAVTDQVIRRYLEKIVRDDIDTLVLGCTHYPLLRDAIKKFVGPEITLVDSAHNCALAVRELLKKEKLAAPKQNLGRLQVALTDSSDSFLRVAERALSLQVGDVLLRTVQGVAGK